MQTKKSRLISCLKRDHSSPSSRKRPKELAKQRYLSELEQSCAAAVKEFDERQKQARATRATLRFSDAYFAKFGLTLS